MGAHTHLRQSPTWRRGDPALTPEAARAMEHTKSCLRSLENMNHEPKQFRRPRW
jgi:hypothetical protein